MVVGDNDSKRFLDAGSMFGSICLDVHSVRLSSATTTTSDRAGGGPQSQ